MNRMSRRTFMLVSSVGAASTVLVACGNDPDETDLNPTMIPVEGAPPTLAPMATPGGAAGGGETEGGDEPTGDAVTEITVTTHELFFEPAEITGPADTDITVTLSNEGVLPHDFVIDDLTVHSDLINGGESTTFTINAPAGTYEFYCAEPGHKEGGMVGTLTIVEGGAAPAGGDGASPAADEAAPVTDEGAGDAVTEITVTTHELFFDPAEFTVPADTEVTVTLSNEGVLPHDFVIDDIEVHSDLINGGESTTITINAPAGTYEFYCAEPGHKEGGMVGTLTVS